MKIIWAGPLGTPPQEASATTLLVQTDQGELLAVAGEFHGQLLLGHCGESDFWKTVEILGLDRTSWRCPKQLQLDETGGRLRLISSG